MKKVKGIVEQCKASGVRIKKGKTAEISDADAYLLVGMKMVKYVDKEDIDAQKEKKGLSTESGLTK